LPSIWRELWSEFAEAKKSTLTRSTARISVNFVISYGRRQQEMRKTGLSLLMGLGRETRM
jgi:hypothetical protein